MIVNYLKLAVRVLLRRKFFTFISLVGISLTLVVLMVATAMLDNVLAPRDPEPWLDRTLYVRQLTQRGPEAIMTTNPGYKFLDRYVRTLPGIERASIFSDAARSAVYQGPRRIELFLKQTDGAYWRILHFRFLEGNAFTESDEANGSFVAVINRATRTKLFGDAPAVGRAIDLEGRRFRVVGVVEDVSFARLAPFADVWVPISTSKTDAYKSQMFGTYNGIVLTHGKDDFERLKDEMQARLQTIPVDDPKTFKSMGGGLDTFFESLARATLGSKGSSTGEVNRRSGGNSAVILRSSMIAAALLFMLLPTLNLVSINLSRIMERASEIGVRKAFGASSRTLVGQFVVENVVLTLIGGLVGFVLSFVALSLLNRSDLIAYARFELNLRIFGYGMLLALFFGIFSGLYPAWRMSRMHPVNALRGGSL